MPEIDNTNEYGAGSIVSSPTVPNNQSLSELTQDDLDMANLSNDSYNDKFESGSGNECNKFVVIDTKSGYDAVVYKNILTGEIIVAHRGTEFDKQFKKDLIQADGLIAIGMNPKQLSDALDFVKKIAKDNNLDPSKVRNTGHSLGGYLSEEVALRLGGKSNSFDSPQSNAIDYVERMALLQKKGANLRIIVSSPNIVNSGIAFYKKLIGDPSPNRIVSPIKLPISISLKDSHHMSIIINKMLKKGIREHAGAFAIHDSNILISPCENTKSAVKSLNNICSGI
jgi:hypothetical protein